MNKLIRSEDNEQLLSELGSLITVVEPNQMRKSAASNAMSRQMLSDHKPDKDHFLVHVIAMGDYETYGFNRNADAFTKQANHDYHNTFVTDGHFFREHKNQDPKFKIGDIVASIHNEEMGRTELAVWGHKKKASDVRDKLHSGEPISVSMSCFPAGTKVRTNNGFVPIELVEEGDRVVSYDGSLQRVNATMERTSNHLVSIDVGMMGKPDLSSTDEHPFYAIQLTSAERKKHAERVRQGVESSFLEKKLEWVQAGDLTDTHYLAIPIHQYQFYNSIENTSYAKLLGYILGDGWFRHCKGKPNTVGFTCGIHDHLNTELDELLFDSGFLNTSKTAPHELTKEANVLTLHDAKFAASVLSDLKGKAKNKSVPDALFNSDIDVVSAFFAGWVNADGWQDQKGIHISTVSYARAYDALRLLAKNNVQSSIAKIHHKHEGNFGSDDYDEYVINISNRFSALLSKFYGKVVDTSQGLKSQDKLLISDNYIFVPIKATTYSREDVQVFNLSVDHNHTYTAEGLVVHNCFVDHDVDSCTEKKAKTPAEYEPHMKHSPGQFVPQFQKYAFVFNPKPRFFDVSYVKKPADRIAHYLDYFLNEDGEMAKAASSGGVIPGALLAKAANIVTPESIAASAVHSLGLKKTEVLKKLAKAEEFYKQYSSADAVGDAAEFIKQAAAYTFDPDYELSEEQLNKLRELQPETMFYELNKRAAVLPYFSFLSYATNRPVDELRKDASASLGQCYLPSVFDDMMEDCKIDDESIFNGHNSSLMSRIDLANTDKVQNLMDEVSDKLTVEPEKAKGRTIRIRIALTKSPKPSEEVEKETKKQKKKASAETTETAKRFAQLYGLYKVAAMEQMRDHFNYTLDNQLLMRVCSQHNFNP